MNSRSTSFSAQSQRRPSLADRRFSRRLSALSTVEQGTLEDQTAPAENALTEEIEKIKRYEDFTTIDWVQDAAREQLRRRARKQENAGFFTRDGTLGWRRKVWEAFDAGQAWLVVTIVGAVIGILAAALNIITEWLSDVKLGYCTTAFYLNEQFCCFGADNGCPEWKRWSSFGVINYICYFIFSLLLVSVSAFLVKTYAPYSAGSGISEIKCIIAGFVMKGFLGFMTLFIKALSMPLAIASGLSVGKEGPSVHYAVCVGNVISRYFDKYKRNASKTREINTATAAAGVAVAFGSPIGGVLFSLEEMASSFPLKTLWRSYFCALVATAVMAAMNPFRTGQLVMFQVKYDRTWHFFELIFFVIIGAFGGLYGAFVIKWNLRWAAFRKKHLKDYAIPEVVIITGLTALICYPNMFLRIDMTEVMEKLFQECEGVYDYDGLCESVAPLKHRTSANKPRSKNRWTMVSSLLIATILRTALVIVSYGTKVPGGIFVPSMAIGASFGRMVGILVQALHETFPDSRFFSACEPDVPCITPGTFAFLGAGAALSGIMHITVSVTVIMFELTGALTYILPTMIVVGVTKAVGDRFSKGGIADRMIWFNGFPFLDNKEEHSFGVPVQHAMKSDLTLLPSTNLTIRSAESLLAETPYSGFPIVDNLTSRSLIGYIGRTELRWAISRARQAGMLSPTARCVFTHSEPRDPQTPLSSAPAITFDDIASSSGQQTVDFSRVVDPTPLSVHPRLPLETVMEVFKKMGPRVILIEHRGHLVGLITVKDCLKYQFKVEAQEHGQGQGQGHANANGSGQGHQRDDAAVERQQEKLWDVISGVAGWAVERVRALREGRLKLRSPRFAGRSAGGGNGVGNGWAPIPEGEDDGEGTPERRQRGRQRDREREREILDGTEDLDAGAVELEHR
ncbi:MAG: hypothetical protein Q9160_003454 [Pyrenula sp. 1 TL-2023]